MANLYLSKTPSITSLTSPLYDDESSLPPMLVQVGSAEVMLDDSVRFVERAKEAKVDVQIEHWEDIFHRWHGSAHILKNTEEGIISIVIICKKLFN